MPRLARYTNRTLNAENAEVLEIMTAFSRWVREYRAHAHTGPPGLTLAEPSPARHR